MDSVWNVEVPPALRSHARPDEADYESDRTNTTFPHRLGEIRNGEGERATNLWLAETPGPDQAVLKFAEAMVDNLDLGADDVTDFFSVSFSQTDAIGHRYGPTSLEQLDNLLRLDRRIGELMSHLDGKVGGGRWVMALSADHGVRFEPELDDGDVLPGRRLAPAEYRDVVRAANAQAANGDPSGASERIAASLRTSPLVAQALTEGQLRSTTAPADTFETLFRNSYYPGRYTDSMARAGVWVRWQEGTLTAKQTGTSHGSPYLYDRHVPLIFYGAGRVAAGTSQARASTADMAPTLARLIGITPPPDRDGKALPLPPR
jgi:predicted AlkP superfamily pyrophosphatase or phosphodiesterase